MLSRAVLLPSVLFFMACSNFNRGSETSTNMNLDREDTKSLELAYQFQEPGCDTGPRVATSQAQLCRNLQLDSQNNNCAEKQRRELFDSQCLGQAWVPQTTLMNTLNGDPLICSTYHGQTLVQSQVFSDESMVLSGSDFFTVIEKTSSGWNLRIQKSYPHGEPLAEATAAVEQTEVEVSVPDQNFRAHCAKASN